MYNFEELQKRAPRRKLSQICSDIRLKKNFFQTSWWVWQSVLWSIQLTNTLSHNLWTWTQNVWRSESWLWAPESYCKLPLSFKWCVWWSAVFQTELVVVAESCAGLLLSCVDGRAGVGSAIAASCFCWRREMTPCSASVSIRRDKPAPGPFYKNENINTLTPFVCCGGKMFFMLLFALPWKSPSAVFSV